MRIRTKISISYILIVLLSLALLAALLSVRVESLFMRNLKDELRKQAFGIAAVIKAGDYSDKRLQPLAKSLSVRFGSRITLIDISGKVLADSEHDPRTMENHAERAEVRKALAGDFGEDLRRSATLKERMLYVAAPIEPLAGHKLIVRVAVPTTKVDETLRNIPAIAVVIFLVIGGIATGLSVWLTRTFTGPIGRMNELARLLSDGHLSERADVESQDELGELSASLNRMAGSLETNVQELSAEKNKLELIVDHIADAIFLLDGKGEVLLANPPAQKLLRMPPAQIRGTQFDDIFRSGAIRELIRRCADEGSECELETEIDFPRRRHIRVLALPLVENETVIGSLVIVQDQTRLRRVDKMRRDFVANVSHELKTPVAGLKLLAETLTHAIDDDPEGALRFSGKISHEANRLSRLVDDLLILSSLEAPEKKVERSQVRVGEIARETVRSFSEAAKEKGLELTSRVREDLPPVIGEERLLRTLVDNLVENAIKYTSGGSVEVRAFAEDEKVVLTVSDTGPGIAEEDRLRIFERFYRIDKGRSRATGGTGLGLSIARHIAMNHDATIRVKSELGKGSTFRVEFPVA